MRKDMINECPRSDRGHLCPITSVLASRDASPLGETLLRATRRLAEPRDVSPSPQGASPLVQGVPSSGQDTSPVAQGGSHTWKTRGCGSCDRGPCPVQVGSRGPTERVHV